MKKALFILFLVVLSLPLLRQVIDWPMIKPLGGYVGVKEVDYVDPTIETVVNRTWQDRIESWVNTSLSARPSYVRFKHYFDYELFDQVHVAGVVKGKEDYLFSASQNYINGGDNVGFEKIQKNALRLKQVQDSLSKLGVPLYFVFAPEKTLVFSEYLPDHMAIKDTTSYMYRTYINEFVKHGVDFIDFNEWFNLLKGNTDYEIFAKGGKHWTHYYATIAFDSIGDRLREAGKFNVPDYINLIAQDAERIREPDLDTWYSANLPFMIESGKFAKPIYDIDTTEKPNVLFVSDSYINIIAWGDQLKRQYHESSEYWYYNREMYDLSVNLVGHPSREELDKRKENIQAYVIITSVGNLSLFDYKFLEYFD